MDTTIPECYFKKQKFTVSQNIYFGGIMPSFIKETKKFTSAIPEVQE